MNKPQYVVKIKGKEFACTGEELIVILEEIQPFINDSIWYASDVEINGEDHFKLGLEKWVPKKVGDVQEVMKLARGVDQFLSGVFFALPIDVGNTWQREFTTEDDNFRDMEEATLEIRAFDTTYFLVYSNNFSLIEKLSKSFNSTIEHFVPKKESQKIKISDQ